MKEKTFSKSMYASSKDLYKAKAEYYQKRHESQELLLFSMFRVLDEIAKNKHATKESYALMVEFYNKYRQL